MVNISLNPKLVIESQPLLPENLLRRIITLRTPSCACGMMHSSFLYVVSPLGGMFIEASPFCFIHHIETALKIFSERASLTIEGHIVYQFTAHTDSSIQYLPQFPMAIYTIQYAVICANCNNSSDNVPFHTVFSVGPLFHLGSNFVCSDCTKKNLPIYIPQTPIKLKVRNYQLSQILLEKNFKNPLKDLTEINVLLLPVCCNLTEFMPTIDNLTYPNKDEDEPELEEDDEEERDEDDFDEDEEEYEEDYDPEPDETAL